MTKTEIYNLNYVKVNHSYVEIYNFYKKLLEAPEADKEVMQVLEYILKMFNPALDRIKSEMTVKTRIKEDPPDEGPLPGEAPPDSVAFETETQANGGKIFHPSFGD